MKVIFFGTPEYAVPVLDAIISSHHKVVAVVTQPDKPKGRSNKPVFTPVKELAVKHNIPVFQYEKIRKDDVSELLNIDADIIVTCAYGQIIGANILFAKKFGVINLHGSLLPKYRGSSPIQWALIDNQKETGVTVLKSDVGMDDGDLLISSSIEISDDDNAITLFDKLSKLSAELAIKALDILESGDYKYSKQSDDATTCKMLSVDMAKMDFDKTADQVVGLIKGLAMWPTAHMQIDGVYFKVFNAKRICGEYEKYQNGEVVIANSKQGLVLKCSDGLIEITELTPQGSKKMSAKSYLNGKKINVGSIAHSE